MTATRAQLEQWDREHLWHPFTPSPPEGPESQLIVERAEGFFLIDVEGNRYIDGVSSLWCNVHGHRVPELDAALRGQLEKLAHSTLLGLANVPAVRLARKLAELAPPGLSHVFFSDNGSTAVEVALKMAFQYWQQRRDSGAPAGAGGAGPRPRKTRYLALSDAYHGDTVGSTSLGGIAHFHTLFGPLLFPTLRAPSPHCYRCPLGLRRDSCQVDCAAAAEDLVRQHHEELAAVVVEPLVQGAAGMVVAPEGYLKRLREVTRRYDVLLIADEVAVGLGRTGTLFACEQEQVVPDFLCLAKGLTGGYLPLAATLTTAEVHSAFLGRPEEGRAFSYGHTYTGNPLAASVALANLELFETRQTLAGLRPRIELLRTWLQRLASLPTVGDVRQKGLMAGIELVRNRETKEPYPPALRAGHAVCLAARKRGAILRPLGNVVVVMPPLWIDLDLLDELCRIVYEAIEEFQNPGVHA